jgi:tetratricopeptide (TPR) repeat protein
MRSSRLPSSALPVDAVFGLLLGLRQREPSPKLPRRLNSLFRELTEPRPGRSYEEIEDLIWTLWISHEDRAAEEAMGKAVEAMAGGSLQKARIVLDGLLALHPDWAEAWNKRATLNFIEKRDAESLNDIEQTLRLEPRHFAAISGFGQICLRNGHLNEAKAAFQLALAINPHLQGLREIIDDLNPEALMLH